MMGSIAQLSRKAKRIRKQHPNMSWHQALRAAAKKTTVKKKSAVKRAVKKTVAKVSKKTVVGMKLKNALFAYEVADTVADTRKARKRINELRKEYRKL